MANIKTARIPQNRVFRAVMGWGRENRKEIELSFQKIKNGISPTPNSPLRTPPDLRFKMVGWGRKSPVLDPGGVFAFETTA